MIILKIIFPTQAFFTRELCRLVPGPEESILFSFRALLRGRIQRQLGRQARYIIKTLNDGKYKTESRSDAFGSGGEAMPLE